MTVLMVRYQVRDDKVTEFEAGVAKMMAAIDEDRPASIRYALCRLLDGMTVVGLLELPDGADNPLLAIPAAQEFQANLRDWVVGDPPVPQPLALVGSYRLFG